MIYSHLNSNYTLGVNIFILYFPMINYGHRRDEEGYTGLKYDDIVSCDTTTVHGFLYLPF